MLTRLTRESPALHAPNNEDLIRGQEPSYSLEEDSRSYDAWSQGFRNIEGLRALYQDYQNDFDNPVFQNSPIYREIVNNTKFNARGLLKDESSPDLCLFLAKIIVRSTSITNIDLGNNNLGEHAVTVVRELVQCPSMRMVNLNHNNLGGHESEVARALAQCKTLVQAYVYDHSSEYGNALFMQEVIKTGDSDHIALVLEKNCYMYDNKAFDQIISRFSYGDAGAGAGRATHELEDASPLSVKDYNMRLHNVLVGIYKIYPSKLGILQEIERNTVRSYLEDKSARNSVLIADKDEEIAKLLLNHLDILVSMANYTKSLTDISSNVFVLSVLANIISSFWELDFIVAKYIYGEDILPLFKSNSEGFVVGVEKIMTSQDFYNLYGFSKIPGSIFNSIFSSEEAMAKLLGLLEDPEIMAQFADSMKFLIAHKEYLPEELSEKICEFEFEELDAAPVIAEPEIDPDMPALYEEPTPLLGDESEA